MLVKLRGEKVTYFSFARV